MSEDEINIKLEEWESSLDGDLKHKLKYPIKIIGSDILNIDIGFSEPSINPPKEKTRKNLEGPAKIIDISSKKKSNKKKLF